MSKEVATVGAEGSAIAKVDEFFRDVRIETDEDPLEVQARIMAQILDAPTIDDAFNLGGAMSAEDLLDVPLRIESVKWQKSSYEQGFVYFAVAFGERLDEAAPVVFTTGAGNIVALLRRAEVNGEFPIQFKMRRKEKATEAGYFPIVFERLTPTAPVSAA